MAHGTVSGSPKVLERRHGIMRNPQALLVKPAKLVGSVGDSVVGRSPEEVGSLPQLGLARLAQYLAAARAISVTGTTVEETSREGVLMHPLRSFSCASHTLFGSAIKTSPAHLAGKSWPWS